jgi:hypothetical protein
MNADEHHLVATRETEVRAIRLQGGGRGRDAGQLEPRARAGDEDDRIAARALQGWAEGRGNEDRYEDVDREVSGRSCSGRLTSGAEIVPVGVPKPLCSAKSASV